jgi:hypothetical protein
MGWSVMRVGGGEGRNTSTENLHSLFFFEKYMPVPQIYVNQLISATPKDIMEIWNGNKISKLN